MRRRGSAIGLAAGSSMVLLTAGCGFLGALADPEAADAERPTATASATATPGPPVPLTIVEGDLLTRGGAPAGHLSVSVGTLQTGLVPPVPVADFEEACSVEGPSLQYVPVDFAFTSAGLAAHVGIGRGPATPADTGQVGIFVESGNGNQVYCADSPPLPTADKFWNQMGAPHHHGLGRPRPRRHAGDPGRRDPRSSRRCSCGSPTSGGSPTRRPSRR